MLVKLFYLEDVGELVEQGLVAEGDADVGHVGARDVVARHPLLHVVRPQPVLLHLVTELN